MFQEQAEQNGDLEAECQKALTQMRALHYEDGMRNAGMQKVFKYFLSAGSISKSFNHNKNQRGKLFFQL